MSEKVLIDARSKWFDWKLIEVTKSKKQAVEKQWLKRFWD